MSLAGWFSPLAFIDRMLIGIAGFRWRVKCEMKDKHLQLGGGR